MKAIILAGGYSKRLWPITKELPKSFLEFAGKPVIDHLMEKLENLSYLDEVIISTNKKFEYFFVYWMNKTNYKKPVKLVVEDTVEDSQKLGALGAIEYVIQKVGINDDLLVIAGDNLFECEFMDFVSSMRESKTTTIAVKDVQSSERITKLGAVTLDANNNVIKFIEKPTSSDITTICAGLYAFPKKDLPILQRYLSEDNNPDATGFLLEWMIKKKLPLKGWLFEKAWFDIGTHSSFDEAKKFYQDLKGTVLVTGGTGYLGHHVTEELLKEGFNVKVMDILLYPFQPDDRCDFILGDVRNEDAVRRALEEVDYVVHLAALSNDPSCDIAPDKTIEINYNGTKCVSTLAKKMGIKRFVFPSSCSVYGDTQKEILIEEDKVNPLTIYAQIKVASEKQLKSLVSDNFDVCLLRFATLFGHSKNMRFDLVGNIIPVEAVVDREIKLFGGSQERPLLHVNDAARAIVAAIKYNSHFKGETFNVGDSKQNYTIKELTVNIQKNIFPNIIIKEFPENTDKRSYRVGFSKINRVLGFQTNTNVINGVKEIAANLQANVYGDPRDDKYFRVKYIKNKHVSL